MIYSNKTLNGEVCYRNTPDICVNKQCPVQRRAISTNAFISNQEVYALVKQYLHNGKIREKHYGYFFIGDAIRWVEKGRVR